VSTEIAFFVFKTCATMGLIKSTERKNRHEKLYKVSGSNCADISQPDFVVVLP
jgi:hypothetical protein